MNHWETHTPSSEFPATYRRYASGHTIAELNDSIAELEDDGWLVIGQIVSLRSEFVTDSTSRSTTILAVEMARPTVGFTVTNTTVDPVLGQGQAASVN